MRQRLLQEWQAERRRREEEKEEEERQVATLFFIFFVFVFSSSFLGARTAFHNFSCFLSILICVLFLPDFSRWLPW